MGTQNTIYIRSCQEIEMKIKSVYPDALTEDGSDFFAIDLPLDHLDDISKDLKKKSTELDTDVLWIAFQSSVELFIYQHWKSGRLQRSLIYGASTEGTWEQVDGQAEPWEAEAFFDRDDLESLLEEADDDDKRLNIQRIFDEQILEIDAWIPMIDARESARAIAEYYNLPELD